MIDITCKIGTRLCRVDGREWDDTVLEYRGDGYSGFTFKGKVISSTYTSANKIGEVSDNHARDEWKEVK